MVAVHPWDLMGAATVGMTTGWIDRTGSPWPEAIAREFERYLRRRNVDPG